MERCTHCILPETFPGITYEDRGYCNYCRVYSPPTYRGGEQLKQQILEFLGRTGDSNRKYDCIVGLSGGRDSTYLLYLLVRELGLKVLAYTATHGFVPDQTKRNINEAVRILDVDLVAGENPRLSRCLRRHCDVWLRDPVPAMIGMLCTGCRLDLDVDIVKLARRVDVPVLISGGTPFEGQGFKLNLLKTNPHAGLFSAVPRFIGLALRNPGWILNRASFGIQLKEFYYHFYRNQNRRKGMFRCAPFFNYIRWVETDVLSTIQGELNWTRPDLFVSSWRSDCDVSLLKMYLYKQSLGFNDIDVGLSFLIRDGQLSRTEALERLDREGDVPLSSVEGICRRHGLDFTALQAAVQQVQDG